MTTDKPLEQEIVKQNNFIFKCPHCDWTTEDDGCQTCISKHLSTVHNIDTKINYDEKNKDMLKWYSTRYRVDFKTLDELDTYILLHNLK